MSYPSALDYLEGAEVVAADGRNLGVITRNVYNTRSIANPFGAGSPYDPASINNPYGTYGNPYSILSPFNPYTATPPRIVRQGVNLGWLTKNSYLPNAV